jgi:type I restriction enzyme S subunit
MKAYPEYKESGVEWIGEIPSHWNLVPLRSVLSFRNEKNDPVKTEQVLSLSIAHGVTQYSDEVKSGNKRKDDLTAYKIARPDDIVMNSMNIIVGAVGISKYFGAISPVYYALYLADKNSKIEYYGSIFEHSGFQKSLLKFGKGILIKKSDSGKLNTIRMKVSIDDLKTLYFPLPPTDEQEKIVNLLSVETARIDNLISEKQNFIKLLSEKRQALISHVVTKGLNPNVPMKDSGVEWVGEIPEHWVAKKLKYCLSIKNGQDYKEVETENIEGSYPVYGSGGEFRRATDYLYDGESVLLGRKGTIDKPMYVNEKFWTVDTMFYSKIHINSDGKFLYYLATTLPFDFYQTKTALPSMTQGDLLNHPVAVPDKLEQIKIRKYIDTQCEIFDELKAEVLKSVELLKEHRTALISAAVTGKIDVREKA